MQKRVDGRLDKAAFAIRAADQDGLHDGSFEDLDDSSRRQLRVFHFRLVVSLDRFRGEVLED